MPTAGEKDPGALLTIGELSQELGVAQHILRYWETRFPQLKPMQRAGNRRYYRPADVELARQINRLLNHEGYTVRGVQKLLRDRSEPPTALPPGPSRSMPGTGSVPGDHEVRSQHPDDVGASLGLPHGISLARLVALRDRLADALKS